MNLMEEFDRFTKQTKLGLLAFHLPTYVDCQEQQDNTLQRHSLTRRLGYALIPQFFRARYFDQALPQPANALPTAWISGVRGLAALAVFNFHFIFSYSDMATRPYGEPGHKYWIELPILSLPHLGLPMVPLFFICAGYTISLKSLQYMAKSNPSRHSDTLKTLASSAFRRWFRLYLPCFVTMAVISLLAAAGLYDLVEPYTGKKSPWMRGRPEMTITARDCHGVWGRLYCFTSEFSSLSDIWSMRDFYPSHDPHLWTVRVEFRASLCLFVVLLTAALMRPRVRLGLLILMFAACMYWDRWDVALYMAGAAIAQMDVLRSRDMADPVTVPHTIPLQESRLSGRQSLGATVPRLAATSGLRILFYMIFVFSLYLLSAPVEHFMTAPGYMTLSKTIPVWFSKKERWLPEWGTVLFMCCLALETPLSIWRRILVLPTVQYLGKISFALYIIHGPVLHLFGYMLPIWFWMMFGNKTLTTYCAGLVIGWIISLSLCLCIADVFHREVETRCVTFTQRLEKRAFV